MLLECVANFSEGRNRKSLDAIATAITGVPGAWLLGMDSGYGANRTVISFAGAPQAVLEAASRAAETAAKHIDMRLHQGIHPRMGALDVCPLIPLKGVSLAAALEMAQQLADHLGSALSMPVYLYALAARQKTRRRLAHIRRGEYEGMPAKMAQPAWQPDAGPASWNPKTGACAVGVRPPMIAYNINLQGFNRQTANWIAKKIRASGYKTRSGQKPGIFRGLQAIGWDVPEFGCSQVSTNITAIEAAPAHEVYNQVSVLAAAKNNQVTGSEVVGLIHRKALLAAAPDPPGKPASKISLQARLEAAIAHLGLNSVKPFNPKTHILEEALQLSEDLPLNLPDRPLFATY